MALLNPPLPLGPIVQRTSPGVCLHVTEHASPDQFVSPITNAGAGAETRAQVYGLLAVGPLLVAIDALYVREAVPYSTQISALPPTVPGLIGAMVLRGETIPLMDLRALLSLPSEEAAADHVVIVLRHRGRIVGLVADALRGMVSAGGLSSMPIERTGGTGGWDTFVHEGTVVSVIEPARVFETPGLPVARDRTAGGETGAGAAGMGTGAAYIMCSYQGHGLAFRADLIEATMPMSPVLPSHLAQGICDGIVKNYGREIAVLDTLQAFGLGRNTCRPEHTAGVIVRIGETAVAFEIDEFHAMGTIPASRKGELPRLVTARPEFFDGAHIRPDGRSFFVVDTEAVRADPGFQSFAGAMIDTRAVAARRVDTGPASRDLFLIFTAGARAAHPVSGIVEILRMPAHLLHAKARYDGYVGMLNHRGRIVPVFCVARLGGRIPLFEEATASVLIVETPGGRTGLMIEELHAVERATRLKKTPLEAQAIQIGVDQSLLQVFDIEAAVPGLA